MAFTTGSSLPRDLGYPGALMTNVDDHMAAAGAHLEAERPAEAAAAARRVLEARPDHGGARVTLGLALTKLGRADDAIEALETAIGAGHASAEAYNGLGKAHYDRLALDAAIAAFDAAIAIKPRWPVAHYHRGMALLLAGRLEAGWPEYEWRLNIPDFGHRHFNAPRWDGAPLAGRTLLVICEQGYGDVFRAVRYLPMLRGAGGRVVFECPGDLAALLAPLVPAADLVRLTGRAPPDAPFDVYAALLSLPGCLGTTLETIPGDVPYLAADRALCAPFEDALAGPGFKVGLVWAGSPRHPDDRQRTTRLRDFAPLGGVPGVRLFGLQVGAAAAETPPPGLAVEALGPALDSFGHTAAVIDRLDLVVTVDTAVAHLAGALAKPVWTLLPFAPDWRWLTGRDDSPWYPTMRLFRQQTPGDWAGVMARVADALRAAAG